jgi:hypothetical protein
VKHFAVFGAFSAMNYALSSDFSFSGLISSVCCLMAFSL